MTTFFLSTKDDTKVKNLVKLVSEDTEALTKLVVHNSDGVEVASREFGKLEAVEGIMNNWSYVVRGKAGWVEERTPKIVDPDAPAKTPKPGVFKMSVQFHDNGTVLLTLGENGDVVFDAESNTFAVPAVVLSTRSAKLAAIAGDPKAAILSATELGEDGKMIRECWKIEDYSSDKVLAADAGMDILAQAGAAKDSAFVKAHGYGIMMGEELPTRFMGGGKKLDWILEWMPEPVKTEKAPDEPSEAPSELKLELAETTLTA